MIRIRKLLPYVIVFAITIFLYVAADRIVYVDSGDRIGPSFWPKTILILAMVTCGFEILKTLLAGDTSRQIEGVLESVVEDASREPGDAPDGGVMSEFDVERELDAEPRRYPHLIVLGVVSTLAYVMLIQVLGFVLSTFLYLVAFMVIGRYRRPLIVLSTSLIGSLLFMFVFMKIVYVSLPLGVEPFAQVSYFLMRLMHIR